MLKTIYHYILIGYASSKNLKNNFARFVSIKLICISEKVKTCEKMLFSQNFLQNHGANEPNHPLEKKIFVVMFCIGHDISKQFITGVDGSR